MAQNWDYAELSKDAKVAGGPEKYVEMLELASKEAGKMEMLPWLGVAAVGASYADEEIDGATYAQKMMELTSSAQNDND